MYNIHSKIEQCGIWRADIDHVYLEATTKEKLYILAGPELVTRIPAHDAGRI